MTVSWFGVVAIVALLYVFVTGLANPRTRPVVVGVAALAGLLMVFIFFARISAVEVREQQAATVQHTAALERARAEKSATTIAVSPPKSSTAETQPPKVSMFAAMRKAIFQAWTTQGRMPTAEAPEKPAKGSKADVRTLPQPPDWVNAPPKKQGDRYTMSVCTDPFVTPWECERDLTRQLQGAVSEYAEITLGQEAAAVRLPDDELQKLVQERWPEVRTMEIGGTNQVMLSLHALVVIDDSIQERIKTEVRQHVVGQQVQGAGVLLAGVLGLLSLAWGGLRLATKPNGKKEA